jgi:hypothetical protein
MESYLKDFFRIVWKGHAAAFVAFLILYSTFTKGAESKGPSLLSETHLGAELLDSEGESLHIKQDVTHAKAHILAPLPSKALSSLLRGMLLFESVLVQESRSYYGEMEGTPYASNSLKSPNLGAFGFIYLPHFAEGAPRYFLVAKRYGDLNVKRGARPMSEYIVGSDIDIDDMPIKIRFATSDEATTRLLLRLRQFPGRQKWLLLVGHKIKTQNGFHLDFAIPSHLTVGQDLRPDDYRLATVIKATSKEFPLKVGGQPQWLDGYSLTIDVNLRKKIHGILYGRLAFGVQKEVIEIFDEQGDKLSEYSTSFAPFAALAIETWIKTP